VRKNVRHAGVGKLLMSSVIEIAQREGCDRVEWTTDRKNENAQRFYAALGYEVNSGKIFYRVSMNSSFKAWS
jgi:GNAT superfamily N-acetyltransferase